MESQPRPFDSVQGYEDNAHNKREKSAWMGMIFCRFAERLKRYSSKSDVLQGRNGSALTSMQTRTEKRKNCSKYCLYHTTFS